MGVTENDLLAAVLSLAKLYGWRTLHIRPARTEKGWRSPVQGDGKGFPDILAVRGNRVLAMELKDTSGKVTPEQQAWLDAFYPVSELVGVWRPADWESGLILATLKGASGPLEKQKENQP